MVFLYTTVCRPPGGGLRILFPAKILGQQEQGTKTTELTLSLCLRMSHRNLAQGTCLQDLVWAISRVQELDQENGSGKTPKLTHPTQLADNFQYSLKILEKNIIKIKIYDPF